MILVGIDISKYKHGYFILTDFGDVLNEGFGFANNAEGFGQPVKELEQCKNGDEIRIGLEATTTTV